MRSLSVRVTAAVWCACGAFMLIAVALGALGIAGVRSATGTGETIASDQLRTSSLTAQFGRDAQSADATGQALALTSSPPARAALVRRLAGQEVPAVDTDLAGVERIHAADGAAEWAGIVLLARQWSSERSQLAVVGASRRVDPALTVMLAATFTPLDAHVQSLIAREDSDAHTDQATAESLSHRITWALIGAVIAAVLAATFGGWAGSRFLRRSLEPAQEQVEFADTLQLAENEGEAHHLLQRHLERAVTGSAVTVLNRNNSADRLEAVTTLTPDSPLAQTLLHAEPRSCLAVRSGRVHDDNDQHRALLGCVVCAGCPGHSTCTPLTVGGEVIGSVLITRTGAYSPPDRQRIRDSVGQAAPVLANLRNLAIAELRAATDSLTGLPNKRAVADTLKRMLAQASRTLTPVCLLMLDLDHFRDINERFGHPVGDQALADVGAALRSALRDSDFAGRNGGEEFVVILPATDLDGGRLAAENIRARIADITLPGIDLTVTASVGLATYPDHATSADRLERLADSALYVAKRSGRNRIEIAAPQPESPNSPKSRPVTHSSNGAGTATPTSDRGTVSASPG